MPACPGPPSRLRPLGSPRWRRARNSVELVEEQHAVRRECARMYLEGPGAFVHPARRQTVTAAPQQMDRSFHQPLDGRAITRVPAPDLLLHSQLEQEEFDSPKRRISQGSGGPPRGAL
jgi:hypothetical protein